MKRQPSRIDKAATHEAGHAVMCYAMGYPGPCGRRSVRWNSTSRSHSVHRVAAFRPTHIGELSSSFVAAGS